VYEPGSTLEPPGFVLTVRTRDGLEGHYRGFMYTAPMITQIKMGAPEFLIGRDPLNREGIWQDFWRAFRVTDHLGLGPMDIALWDLAGKYYDEPVSALLGGYRDRVPAYASTYTGDRAEDGLSSSEAYADFAEACLADGYPAFKIHAFGDPARDIEVCRAVAEAVGDEMDLMLDPASEYQTYGETLRVGRVLDDLGYFWYEDPMSDTGQSVRMARRLARDLDTPILGMEHVRTGSFGAADHMAADALDLVRGDVHLDGGITGVMKIANVAEAFGVDVELHVGGPAHLHCMSAIRNTNYFEDGLLHPQIEWMGDQGFVGEVETLEEDGTITVPDGPGLGVEIDWEFVEEREVRPALLDETGASGLS
jgi:L-alanine-DL-glutamate epimerase-like enolase superfamily enzyme